MYIPTSVRCGNNKILSMISLPEMLVQKIVIALCNAKLKSTISCNIVYRKHRKFRGVVNFVVFADATIPRNLILGR